MPFVKGFLRVLSRGEVDNELPDVERPADPGFGIDQGGSIDNSLPPGWKPIGSTLPEQPPGVWPPLSPSLPVVPALPWVPPGMIWPPPGRPPGHVSGQPVFPPGHPSAGLPIPPNYVGGGPVYPPGHPSAGLPIPPGHPGNALPIAPVRPGHDLPPGEGTATPPIAHRCFWMLAYCPSLGWNFVAVDPSLSIGWTPAGPQPK